MNGTACTNNGDCDIDVGQRDHLSKFDGLTLSSLYVESNWHFVDQSLTGPESGTFLEPFKTVDAGFTDVPNGGTVIIQPGSYK